MIEGHAGATRYPIAILAGGGLSIGNASDLPILGIGGEEIVGCMGAALPDVRKKRDMQHPVAISQSNCIQIAAVMRAIGFKAIFEVGLGLGKCGQRQSTRNQKQPQRRSKNIHRQISTKQGLTAAEAATKFKQLKRRGH